MSKDKEIDIEVDCKKVKGETEIKRFSSRCLKKLLTN